MRIVNATDIASLQNELVDTLSALFIQNCTKPILFLYSGGSAMKLYPLLFDRLEKAKIKLHDCWFAPVDERFDRTASNFTAFQALSCARGFEHLGVRFLDVLEHGHSLEDCGYWFSEWVRVEMDRVRMADGVIISLLGVGADGHTAGIFPYPENEEFFNGEFVHTKRFAVGYDVGDKNEYRERVTLTVPALADVHYTFVYALGETKKDVLEKVKARNQRVFELPATALHDLTECALYTDIIV